MRYRIEKLKNSGDLNDYFFFQLEQKLDRLPPSLQEIMMSQAVTMSKAGVDSEADQATFFMIMSHCRLLAEELCGKQLNDVEIARVSQIVFMERAKFPINTIEEFYCAVANALAKVGLSIKKMAYPQGFFGQFAQPGHNIDKWLKAMQDIYWLRQKKGMNSSVAFSTVTENWNEMEKNDFSYWLRFYQENAHMKYKTAQQHSFYDTETEGYHLPIRPEEIRAGLQPGMPNMSGVEQYRSLQQAESDEEKNKKIDETMRKILSRLSAAERLLASHEGKDFAGEQLKPLMETLSRLKLEVLTVSQAKKSQSSLFYKDLLIKHANILEAKGADKGAKFLFKMAQEAPPEMPPALPLDSADPAMDPAGAESSPPLSSTPLAPEQEPGDWAKELFSQLSGEDLEETKKKASAGDALEEVETYEDGLDAAIVVEAQAPPPAPTTAPAPAPQPEDLEVTEEDVDVASKQAPRPAADVEDVIDAALEKVTVQNVIDRLELVGTMFKNRQLAKQLAIIDMMLDHLGLSSFFPGLGEATRSALESNQYVLTRLEEILSKLRGAAEAEHAEEFLHSEERESPAEIAGTKQKLQEGEAAEEERKALRKEHEHAKLKAQQEPAPPDALPQEEAAETEEALGPPAEVEHTPPVPVG